MLTWVSILGVQNCRFCVSLLSKLFNYQQTQLSKHFATYNNNNDDDDDKELLKHQLINLLTTLICSGGSM